MPRMAADAPDRITDSHGEANPHRSPPHEADTVALEELLECTRITRKGHPVPSSFHPHLKWWLQEHMCLKVN